MRLLYLLFVLLPFFLKTEENLMKNKLQKPRFHHQTVLITGGAQGIGKAICIQFAQEGANVAIVDIDKKKGVELERQLKSQGFSATFFKTDVSKEEEIKLLIKAVTNIYGPINILINNAAKFIQKGLTASSEDWTEELMTNVVGYALCAKYCVPYMKQLGKGAIVNIGSMSGFIAQPNFLTYNTSKGAIVNMTRCLAQELAPFNIRVNSVCPGIIWTENSAKKFHKLYKVNKEQAHRHPEIGGLDMLQRVGDPTEIAKPVLFMASDDASYITGENLMVDAGYIQQ